MITLYIGFGAAAHGKVFRLYSIATILIFLVFGALAGMQASQAAQFSAPWMGVEERVCYYSYLLWILAFAVVRLRIVGKESQDHINHSMKGLEEFLFTQCSGWHPTGPIPTTPTTLTTSPGSPAASSRAASTAGTGTDLTFTFPGATTIPNIPNLPPTVYYH